MKTASILLVAVTLSTSLFLQSSAAPDTSGLGGFLSGIRNTASTLATDAVSVAEGTLSGLLGKGVRTCPAYVLTLKELGPVLLGAQKRLMDLLIEVIKKIKDVIKANSSGPCKEMLTELSASLEVCLEGLPELLKLLVAIIVNPTHKGLNKFEAAIKQLEQIRANHIDKSQVLTHESDGTLPFMTSAIVATSNSLRDGFRALVVVANAQRRILGD